MFFSCQSQMPCKKKNLSWLVDNPIDTKRFQKTKGLKYPSKIDLESSSLLLRILPKSGLEYTYKVRLRIRDNYIDSTYLQFQRPFNLGLTGNRAHRNYIMVYPIRLNCNFEGMPHVPDKAIWTSWGFVNI